MIRGEVRPEEPIEEAERLRFRVVAVSGRPFAVEKALEARRKR